MCPEPSTLDRTEAPTTDSATRPNVVGLTSGVATVPVGRGHTCAVTTAGGIKCWGSNGDDQLGDGTGRGNCRSTPVDVVGFAGVSTAGDEE